MKTAEDIESYLIRMDSNYDVVGENIWVVKDGGADLVVSIAGPVLVFILETVPDARVMAGRDDHPAAGLVIQQRERNGRRGRRPVTQIHFDSIGGHHSRHRLGKPLRAKAGIVSHRQTSVRQTDIL